MSACIPAGKANLPCFTTFKLFPCFPAFLLVVKLKIPTTCRCTNYESSDHSLVWVTIIFGVQCVLVFLMLQLLLVKVRTFVIKVL